MTADIAPPLRHTPRPRLYDPTLLASKRFVLFVLVSGFAALVNLLAGIVFRQWLSFTLAAVFAFGCGLITAFVLNRIWVFRGSERPIQQQAGWFLVINLTGLAMTVLIGLLMARIVLPWLDWTWYPDTVAHAIGIAAPVITSYLGHKHLSFRGSGIGPREHPSNPKHQESPARTPPK